MVLHLIDMDSDEEKESIDANYLLLDNDDPSEQASLQQTAERKKCIRVASSITSVTSIPTCI
jgi:hypothetical protein